MSAAAAALGGRHCSAFSSSKCNTKHRSHVISAASALHVRQSVASRHAPGVLPWQQQQQHYFSSSLHHSGLQISSQQQRSAKPRHTVVASASAAAAPGSGDAEGAGALPIRLSLHCCPSLLAELRNVLAYQIATSSCVLM